MKSLKSFIATTLTVLLVLTLSSFGAELALSPTQIVASTDMSIVGEVLTARCYWNEQGSAIMTEYRILIDTVIFQSGLSEVNPGDTISMIFAGGTIDDISTRVSSSMKLDVEARYVLFVLNDDNIYANPVVGGTQGAFRVLSDPTSGTELVSSFGGLAVTAVNADHISLGNPLDRNGHPVDNSLGESEGVIESPDPFANEPSDGFQPADSKALMDSPPLELKTFIDTVNEIRNTSPTENPLRIRSRETGRKLELVEGSLVSSQLEMADPTDFSKASRRIDSSNEVLGGCVDCSEELIAGTNACACGKLNLTAQIEKVPSSWSWYSTVGTCITTWNAYMYIWYGISSNGTWGDNGVNEIAGWIPEATLERVYGFKWGSALAMTVMSISNQCGRMNEADIFFNPSYSWTDSEEYAIGNSSVLLLRPILMHELGHVWGYFSGVCKETYRYDFESVMHSYHPYIVENGRGTHATDAYLMRRHYDDQTSILTSFKDIGVESYYANEYLYNSSTNKSTYVQGESIQLKNVLVENMSYYALYDVRLRFYLSTNRTISTSDYQIGGYWYWNKFPGEAYSRGTYTTSIPSNIPPGTYYIGMMVTHNGYGSDSFSSNNTTTFRYTIEVKQKNRAPSISYISDKSVKENQTLSFYISASDPDGDPITYAMYNLPTGATFDRSTRRFTWTPSYTQAGTYRNVYATASDGKLSDTEYLDISVSNVNRTPILSSISPKSGSEGSRLTIQLSASDSDTDNKLVYSSSNLPRGSSLNSSTGLFSWIPDFDQSGVYMISFRVSDGYAIDSKTATVSIANVNRSPSFSNHSQVDGKEDNLLTFQLEASDPDKEDVLSYSSGNLPDGATLDSRTGIVNWTPGYDQAGLYSVVFNVSDGSASDETTIDFSIVNTNRSPTISVNESNLTGREGTEFVLGLSVNDPDGDIVTASIANMPEGMQAGSSSFEWRWTPTYEQSGQYDLLVEATDRETTVRDTVSVTILNVNRPPQFTGLPDNRRYDVFEDELIEFDISGVDPDEDTKLEYGIDRMPQGASLHSESGTFKWKPTFEQAGTYPIGLWVSDGEDTTRETISIEVLNSNRAPSAFRLVSPQNEATVSDQKHISFTWLKAVDTDSEDSVTYKFTMRDAAGEVVKYKADISETSYVIETDIPSGDYIWSVVAVDSYGDTTTCNSCFTLTILDLTPPQVRVTIHPNPILPAELDIFIESSEKMAKPPTLFANGPISSDSIETSGDISRNAFIYESDFRLTEDGEYFLEACGTDLSGNLGCGEIDFSSKQITPGMINFIHRSSCNLTLSIPGMSLQNEFWVLVMDRTDKQGSSKQKDPNLRFTVLPENKQLESPAEIRHIPDSESGTEYGIYRVSGSELSYIPTKIVGDEIVASIDLFGSFVVMPKRIEDINADAAILPGTFSLEQNWPNPFNPKTRIDFSIPEPSHVKVEIFNLLGQSVLVLLDQYMSAGSHTIEWRGMDNRNKPVSSGIYFYRLQAGTYSKTKKMMLLK